MKPRGPYWVCWAWAAVWFCACAAVVNTPRRWFDETPFYYQDYVVGAYYSAFALFVFLCGWCGVVGFSRLAYPPKKRQADEDEPATVRRVLRP